MKAIKVFAIAGAAIALSAQVLSAQVMQQAASVGAAAAPAVPPASGMTLWVSADCITYPSSVCTTPADGTSISAWADHSGNANNMSLQAGSNMTFHSSSASINSKPYVVVPNSQVQLTSAIASSSGYSVFAVLQLNGTGKGDILSCGPSSPSTACFKYWVTTTQGIDSAAVAQVGTGSTTLGLTWHQTNATFVNNSSTVNFRLDRATDTTASPASANMTNPVKGFGASGAATELLNAQVADLIFYNRVLSGSEIATVEAYFRNKYGL